MLQAFNQPPFTFSCIAILSVKQIHQILKKNKYVFLCFLFRDDLSNIILATPSAPHYFYFNCCFNIKTFSYCSEDFNFDYSSHGSVLFICTQQVMEDSNMFTSICDGMQCESIKELDAENKFAQIVYMDIIVY
ncbi:hypothetical protein T4D_4376 [Trichinella pseudospiralis]|uniref:Uncharacterized protein n=1 Tax=Trichinella pseudospiralis TaxID=6337 RepID=A0A0V1F4K5_TRIPS|nr:hypothetical protein T4D_4376 [Trichinella pseudospiralis]